MAVILNRIHFGELPTIYPPVSQAAFALCAWLTPSAASLVTRLVLMKAWFVACDVLTLLVVIRLLRLSNRPIGLALAYAWCPLLLKEIANSGHLDSLAFLLTTLAAYFAAQARTPSPVKLDPAAVERGRAAAVQCTLCHGVSGKGDASKGVPDLTGQPPGYLRNQMLLFKADRRSPGDEQLKSVKALMRTIPDEQIADLAAYWSSVR